MRLDDKHLRLEAEELHATVRDARRRTRLLVDDLTDAQIEVPLLANVNPPRWELGHVAFFFEVFFLRELGRDSALLPGADELFDSFEVAHDTRWRVALPTRPEVIRYMDAVLDEVVTRLGDGRASPVETYLALLCAQHEDMHGEAFVATRQALEYPAPAFEMAATVPGKGGHNGDADIPGGTFFLGADESEPFVFDNEKWRHPVAIAPFRIGKAPVTNEAFAAFVDDGGYSRRELWSAAGWNDRMSRGVGRPRYWMRGEGGWLRRHFGAAVALEPHAPVSHVSWHEAEAYCRWAGRRLPSEAEWEMAALLDPETGGKRSFPWGEAPPDASRANLDGARGGAVDVAAFPGSDSAWGCRQMLGNVWEWTSSAFYPYPGYVVDVPYREYSAPWFGYHKVLRGGSWATRTRVARSTYRNFFLPDRGDVIAGFRTCAP